MIPRIKNYRALDNYMLYGSMRYKGIKLAHGIKNLTYLQSKSFSQFMIRHSTKNFNK